MSWAAVIIGGVSLVGSGIKYAQGRKQQRQAEAMRPVNPGYQQNQGVIDNARILRERYGNYMIPGYEQALANINMGGQMAFSQGVQGASSSGDVIDLASRIAYGQSQAQNQLAMQNAQGRDAALMDYISANARAGQEATNANAWDREQYLRLQQQQADLYNAGQINQQGAISEGLNTLGTVAAYNMSAPQTPPQIRGGYVNPVSTGQPNYGTATTPVSAPPTSLPPANVQQPYTNSGTYLQPLTLRRIRNVQPVYNLPYR